MYFNHQRLCWPLNITLLFNFVFVWSVSRGTWRCPVFRNCQRPIAGGSKRFCFGRGYVFVVVARVVKMHVARGVLSYLWGHQHDYGIRRWSYVVESVLCRRYCESGDPWFDPAGCSSGTPAVLGTHLTASDCIPWRTDDSCPWKPASPSKNVTPLEVNYLHGWLRFYSFQGNPSQLWG